MRSRRSTLYVDLARQRIVRLYRMAVERARSGDIEGARRLAGLAWDLYKATRVRIPRYIKRGICRRCRAPLIPGVTARVRLHSQGGFSYVTVTCLACGWMRRYPYKRRRPSRPTQGSGGGERESEEEGQAGASRPRRRDNRQERRDTRRAQGDRREASGQGGSEG